MSTHDRIEQAARELYDIAQDCIGASGLKSVRASIWGEFAAVVRRERDDAARVERDECAKACDDCYQYGCASAIRARQ